MTTTQPTFDLAELRQPEHDPEATIQERFEAFNAANPWVIDALETLTRDWLATGHRKAGVKALMEVVRWQYGRHTQGDTFRCNNNWTSRYARLLVERNPDWADVFETRELRAA